MVRVAVGTDSHEALVAAVEDAIAHVQAGKHDAYAQHRAVVSMYSWPDTVRRLERVYERVMRQAPRSSSERLLRYAD